MMALRLPGGTVVEANLIKIDIDASLDPLINEWAQRRAERRDDRKAVLSQLDLAMDVARAMAERIDDVFRILIDYYTNPEIVSQPDSLQDLKAETRQFLSRQDSLPVLEECTATIQAASIDKRLDDSLRSTLAQLSQEFDEYREHLGYQWATPVTLLYVYERATAYSSGEVPIDQVTDLASQVRQDHPIARMSRIRALTGKAKWQTGADVLPPRNLFYRFRPKA
jgi:hypothetical protein